jgi:hypothetical protein
VTAVLETRFAVDDSPHHHMCCARTYFVVAARTPIVFDGTRARYRPHLVIKSVGAHLDSAPAG